MLPSIRLRAAIAEASAQALPLSSMGKRSGAPEAVADFDALWSAISASARPRQEAHHGGI